MSLKDFFSFRPRGVAVQTGRPSGNSYESWLGYIPLVPPDAALFDAMREAIPIIDAALDKIVRLTGSFAMECSSPRYQQELDEFVENVQVGASYSGLHQFVSSYLYSLLTYGNAAGEIIPHPDGGGIVALYNAKLRDLHIRQGRSPLEVELCTLKNGQLQPVPYPDLILFTALNPPAGELRGVPILRGLPFVSGILIKIFHCMGTNFERAGNLRYAVTYRPGDQRLDKVHAKDIAENIAREWSSAMNATGSVRDFVAVGDVDIKVIGADSQMLETQVPVRQMLEQMVAKLGIPPFMLGLHWSTTERMSVQQADILTSELESYRRLLNPVLTRICNLFLALRGYAATARPVWSDINLQDEAEAANIRLLNARAKAIEAEIAQSQGKEEW
ncbi:MAG: serine/threonine protein phosphatase [Oscillospiraceae bacterium]